MLISCSFMLVATQQGDSCFVAMLHGDGCHVVSVESNPYMEMVAEVEQLHIDNPDANDRKVEQLRRDCRMLFAVVLFSSEVWGHNQKREYQRGGDTTRNVSTRGVG